MSGIKALVGMSLFGSTMVATDVIPKPTILSEYVAAGTNVLLLAGILALAGYIVWRQKYVDKTLAQLTMDAAKVAADAAVASARATENVHELRQSTDRLVVATVNLESTSANILEGAKTMHDSVLACAAQRGKP